MSHRVGKVRDGQHRQIFVKFAIKVRERAFSAKSALKDVNKNSDSKIYINDQTQGFFGARGTLIKKQWLDF